MKFISIAQLFILLLINSILACAQEKEELELRVLQFNIWQEGTQVENGFNAIVDEIISSRADLVALSEVRNYKGINFTKKLVNALKDKGHTYYENQNDDSNLISRFPILSHGYLYGLKNDKGSITKAVIDIKGCEVAFYSAHLDYTNYACYLPRGYCGKKWSELNKPENKLKKVLKMNANSYRDDQIAAFINDGLNEAKQGRLVILGGDFNEPSHKDWTEETKDLFDHNGLSVPWHCTTMLEQKGFVDTYRGLYPNPVSHPGFTWVADNRDKDVSELTWTPKADERDRIDYIFHYPDNRLKLQDAYIIGPKASIVKNKRVQEESDDKIVEPLAAWPTDHKALLVIYTILVD